MVRQYETTVAGEKLLEGMAAGNFDVMKKMLLAEVGGMRVVRDALVVEREKELAQQEQERFLVELRHLGTDLSLKEVSVAVCEMVEGFAQTPEVQSFLQRWRKIMMHGQQRVVMRAHAVADFDRDGVTDLLEGAIELADTLTGRYPDRAATLTQYRELLREHLAGHQ